MMVVKIYMWPGGDESRERLMAHATFSLLGVAKHDEGDVKKGERIYLVQLLKDVDFGGPQEGGVIRPDQVRKRDVWRDGIVRGHRPPISPARGTWDLIGGALKALLGRRLDPYVKTSFEDDTEPSG